MDDFDDIEYSDSEASYATVNLEILRAVSIHISSSDL